MNRNSAALWVLIVATFGGVALTRVGGTTPATVPAKVTEIRPEGSNSTATEGEPELPRFCHRGASVLLQEFLGSSC
jgi:hypothetical protein